MGFEQESMPPIHRSEVEDFKPPPRFGWKLDGPSYVVGVFTMGVLAVMCGIVLASTMISTITIPKCQEDETYLQGSGNYSNGHFETYVCVHPDNLKNGQR
jgi:hypothetical protein